MEKKAGIVIGVIGFGFLLAILLGLLYLRWISTTAFFLILASKFVIVGVILLSVFLIRRLKKPIEVASNDLQQHISYAELKEKVKTFVLAECAEHFSLKSFRLMNVGTGGKRTSIAVIVGRGDLRGRDIAVLVNLNNPDSVFSLLQEDEVREDKIIATAEGMSSSPPVHETRLIRRKNEMTGDVVEETTTSAVVDEAEVEAKKAEDI